MGKKYIIELEREEIAYKTVNSNGTPMIQLLAPAPYTEPDLDAIRKEAYAEGYEDGMQLSIDDAKLKEEYKRGLSDMRDALKLIEKAECVDDLVSLGFDVETAGGWSKAIELLFEKYSPSEIIEKIRQYEQKQEKKDGVWIASEANEPSVDTTLICSECGYTITIKPGDTQSLNFCPKCGDCKTGRHFSKTAEATQKMKETE